jgi:hypothetical protein
VALALGGLSGAAPAWADCPSPAPAIVWSHPAHGATDVPTNADLWILLSDWYASPRVALGGSELRPLDLPFGYDLGELAPDTTYTLEVQDAEATGERPRFELTFTTGSGPAEADADAAPGVVTASSFPENDVPALAPLCQAALNTQDCFDQGQDTYYEFSPSGEAAGWLIASQDSVRSFNVWPGECGAPRLLGLSLATPCVTLYGIDASGVVHRGEEVCAAHPGEGDDLLRPSAPPAGTPGVVLPASTRADEAEDERPAPAAPATPAASAGCSLERSRDAGCTPWTLLLGVVVGWRARRSRRGLNAS